MDDQIKLADIKRAVAKKYNLTVAQLISGARPDYIAHPRQVAMYLAKKLLGLSYPDLGPPFGGRDHTTVMYGAQRVAWLIGDETFHEPKYKKVERGSDAMLKQEVGELMQSLQA
jgi:chromosomal replication initiator protein